MSSTRQVGIVVVALAAAWFSGCDPRVTVLGTDDAGTADGGASFLFFEDFESIPADSLPWGCEPPGAASAAPAGLAFTAAESLCSATATAMVGADDGRGGTRGARITWSPGGAGEEASLVAPGSGAGYPELYVRVWMCVQQAFPFGAADGFRFMRISLGAGRVEAGLELGPTGPGGYALRLSVDGADPVATTWTFAGNDDGLWHPHEIHFKVNTPGAADGALEYWVDGVFVLSLATWAPRPAGDTRLLWPSTGSFAIGGRMFAAPAAAASVSFDEIAIGAERIGP